MKKLLLFAFLGIFTTALYATDSGCYGRLYYLFALKSDKMIFQSDSIVIEREGAKYYSLNVDTKRRTQANTDTDIGLVDWTVEPNKTLLTQIKKDADDFASMMELIRSPLSCTKTVKHDAEEDSYTDDLLARGVVVGVATLCSTNPDGGDSVFEQKPVSGLMFDEPKAVSLKISRLPKPYKPSMASRFNNYFPTKKVNSKDIDPDDMYNR